MRHGPRNLGPIARRFSFPVTRNRWDAPTPNSEGLLPSGDPTTTTIYVHAWPAKGETIERLPDGIEASSVYEGTTTDELLLGDESTGRRADSIEMFGSEYEVIEVGRRGTGPDGTVTWRTFVAVEVVR